MTNKKKALAGWLGLLLMAFAAVAVTTAASSPLMADEGDEYGTTTNYENDPFYEDFIAEYFFDELLPDDLYGEDPLYGP